MQHKSSDVSQLFHPVFHWRNSYLFSPWKKNRCVGTQWKMLRMLLQYKIISTIILCNYIVFQVCIKLHGLTWASNNHLKHHPVFPYLSAFPWLISLPGLLWLLLWLGNVYLSFKIQLRQAPPLLEALFIHSGWIEHPALYPIECIAFCGHHPLICLVPSLLGLIPWGKDGEFISTIPEDQPVPTS